MITVDLFPTIDSAEYKAFRKFWKRTYELENTPCALCGQRTINYRGEKDAPDSFELDHKISRKRARAMGRPDLVMDPNNVQPAHVRCNRGKGAGDASIGLGEVDEDY